MNKNIDTSYFFVLLLLFVGLFAVGYIYNIQNTERDKETLLFSEFHWEERISSLGPQEAYKEFIQLTTDMSPSPQHKAAHIFGSALYNKGDIKLMSVCSGHLAFGCVHEFIGRAIIEHGIQVTKDLADVCSRTVGNDGVCHHSIGHGIQAHLGYEEDNLSTTLNICDAILANNDMVGGGCYGGAFMEYNLQTMLGDEGEVRPLLGDLLSPCNRLEEKYRSACYFRQPDWWRHQFLQKDIETTVLQLGKWCATLPFLYVPSCFRGIGGVVIIDVNSNILKAVSLCDSSTKIMDYRLVCRLQTLVSKGLLIGVTSYDIRNVCSNLDSFEQKKCNERVITLIKHLVR